MTHNYLTFQCSESFIVGSMEALSKAFLLFFLPPDWPKLNHLKVEWNVVFQTDIFSRHFCSTVAKTIGLTNYAASFGAKKCSENQIEAAEMILDLWNQQFSLEKLHTLISIERVTVS